MTKPPNYPDLLQATLAVVSIAAVRDSAVFDGRLRHGQPADLFAKNAVEIATEILAAVRAGASVDTLLSS